MQTKAIILTFMAAVAFPETVAAIGCFSGGQTGNLDAAKAAIPDMCNILSGHYGDIETRSQCTPNDPQDPSDDTKWDFKVYNGDSNAQELSKEDCSAWFEQQLGCEHGGIAKQGSWQITLDPNRGKCEDPNSFPPAKKARGFSA